jgi:hypothetical protein
MYQSPFCPLLPIKWMLCKKTLFFSTTCVCVFYFFSHTPKAKTQILFFLLRVGGDIICKKLMMGILAFNSIYPTTTLEVFHINLYLFQKCWNFQFYFIFPQVAKKIWKKILNIQKNSIWLRWFFKLFIYLFDKHFLKLATKVFFYKKLINYLTNIGSTCQGITIYDIIIRCKNKSPSQKNNLRGILEKIYLFKVFIF